MHIENVGNHSHSSYNVIKYSLSCMPQQGKKDDMYILFAMHANFIVICFLTILHI